MTAARGLIIAAAASHSGKTMISVGLVAALRARGLNVAAAKCGPDYIDPKFLAAASGAPAINLDPWAMPAAGWRGMRQGPISSWSKASWASMTAGRVAPAPRHRLPR